MLLGIGPSSSVSFYTTVPCVGVLFEVSGNLENSSGLHPHGLTDFMAERVISHWPEAQAFCLVLAEGQC